MLELVGYLGINSYYANKIVSFINSYGGALLVVSVIITIASAGGASIGAATGDYLVYTVEEYLAKNAWARAVAF